MSELQLFVRARSHGSAIALRTYHSKQGPNEQTVLGRAECTTAEGYSFNDLLERSAALAQVLLGPSKDLKESRVASLLPAGLDYVTTQWATWRSGGVFVPLSLSATEPELQYTLNDSIAQCVVTTRALSEKIASLCERLGLRLLIVDADNRAQAMSSALPVIDPNRRAMILYTSGTTSTPKGVVTTHANVEAQIRSLVEAWEWQSTDCIPLFLPLHHIHGIINVLSCALWSGATSEPFSGFDMDTILDRVANGVYSVFMAVPTIYVKIIQKLETISQEDRDRIIEGFSRMRLMISGSAALPASIHEKWSSLTGQHLLERYGMTEIGMGLSNPYHGERRPGAVGQPLPGVEIRLWSEQGDLVTTEGESGEIQVRGPGVFLEYWNRPEITQSSFDNDWFQTGDIAVYEEGYYRILGRSSVDIIKSGGYKLSALEIESTLLDHPAIGECAVVGIPDDTWGEAVVCAVVLREKQHLSLESLRSWCHDRLSKYKIPKRLLLVDQLPRNAMGKITKPAVHALF